MGVISGNGVANLTARGAITFEASGAIDASALRRKSHSLRIPMVWVVAVLR